MVPTTARLDWGKWRLYSNLANGRRYVKAARVISKLQMYGEHTLLHRQGLVQQFGSATGTDTVVRM
jgi:hypothetical protein